MSDKEDIRYISDPTLPNAGRVYDYLLGGDYNFPIDKKVAYDIEKKIPFIKDMVRLIRWFLGNVVDKAFNMGYTQFIDFASGLPTVDHIHTRIPENIKDKVKIMYSDIDPITVQIGQKKIEEEIKSDYPSVRFIECDCRKPEILLESDITKSLFDMKKKFAIGFCGIFWFLSDEQIDKIASTVYEWAPNNSIIYFNDFNTEALKIDSDIQAIFDYYKEMSQPIYSRPQKELIELVKPWKVQKPGLLTFEKWLDYPLDDIAKKWKGFTGGTYYGGFLKK